MNKLTTLEHKEKEILLNTGEIIKYSALHTRLIRKYGKAKCCMFCDSPAKRYKYALVRNAKYSLNIEDYLELCPSCHRKYDMTEEVRKNVSRSKKGIKQSEEAIKNRKISINNNPVGIKVFDIVTGTVYRTINEAAISLGMKKITLCAMLKGQNPNKTNIRYYEQ